MLSMKTGSQVTYICIQHSQQKLRDDSHLFGSVPTIICNKGTYRICASIQFVQESLVPGVDTVFEHLFDSRKQPLFSFTTSRELKIHQAQKFFGFMVFNKGGSGASSSDGKSVSCRLGACIFISGPNEGNNERLNGFEELRLSAMCPLRIINFSRIVNDNMKALNSLHQLHPHDSAAEPGSSHFGEAMRFHLKPLQV